MNCDWVNNQACRLSHDIQVVSHSFITFNIFFKLITKIYNLNHHKIQVLICLIAEESLCKYCI